MARSLAVEMALQQRSVGRRIAELRNERRFTQEEAADLAGVTLRAYQKWEAGGGIQFANLRKLADIFGTTTEYIVGTADTPNPFRVGEQLTDIREEFHGRIDHLEEMLERNYQALEQIFEAILAIATAEGQEAPAPPNALQALLAEPSPQRLGRSSRSTGSPARARQRAS